MFKDGITRTTAHQLQAAWAQWCLEHVEKGFVPSLTTFMFDPLPGKIEAQSRQMRLDIELFYSRFVTRCVRDPRQSSKQHLLPRMIGCSDLPVFKRDGQATTDTRINAGLHVHATMLVNPGCRLRETFQQHITRFEVMYRHGTRMASIHVVPVRTTPERAASYVFKCLGTATSLDDVIVLPRHLSELSKRS